MKSFLMFLLAGVALAMRFPAAPAASVAGVWQQTLPGGQRTVLLCADNYACLLYTSPSPRD